MCNAIQTVFYICVNTTSKHFLEKLHISKRHKKCGKAVGTTARKKSSLLSLGNMNKHINTQKTQIEKTY